MSFCTVKMTIVQQWLIASMNTAIVDSRFFPQHATCDEYLLVSVVEQNSIGISAGGSWVQLLDGLHCYRRVPARPTYSWPPQQDCLPSQWAAVARARPRPLVPLPGELHNAYWSHGMKIIIMTSFIIHKPWKYITYRNAVREGPVHGHREHTQKFIEVRLRGFRVMRADRQTDKHTYSSQYFAPLWGRSN